MSERVVVAGSRGLTNYQLVEDYMNSLALKKGDVIISGGAPGADTLGEIYADHHGLDLEVIPAKWDVYGKRAGYLRNEVMASTATRVVVFWDGESRGSKHMIDIANKKGVTLNVIYY